jgi:hypothetical protein
MQKEYNWIYLSVCFRSGWGCEEHEKKNDYSAVLVQETLSGQHACVGNCQQRSDILGRMDGHQINYWGLGAPVPVTVRDDPASMHGPALRKCNAINGLRAREISGSWVRIRVGWAVTSPWSGRRARLPWSKRWASGTLIWGIYTIEDWRWHLLREGWQWLSNCMNVNCFLYLFRKPLETFYFLVTSRLTHALAWAIF